MHSGLEMSMSIFRGRRSTLVFRGNRIGFAELSRDKVQISWQVWYIMVHRESVILRLVAGAAWWTSIVRGMSFFAASAIFGTLSCSWRAALARLPGERCCLCLSCHFACQAQYHSTLHTFHSHIAHVQFHSTFHTPHFTLHTPQTWLYTPQTWL